MIPTFFLYFLAYIVSPLEWFLQQARQSKRDNSYTVPRLSWRYW